jgi:hypothetical protein
MLPGVGANMPIDDRRLRIRLGARMRGAEQDAHDTAVGALPAEDSWRYRRDGLPRAFAAFGVVAGYAALLIPGIFALRSYRRWQRGDLAEPTLPWSLAVVGLISIPLVPLFLVLPIVAVGLALLCGLPLLILVGPRH